MVAVFQHIAQSLTLASFILSLAFCFQISAPAYMRIFPAYPFLSMLTELITWLIGDIDTTGEILLTKPVLLDPYIAFNTIEPIMLYIFFKRTLREKIISRIIPALLIMQFVLVIVLHFKVNYSFTISLTSITDAAIVIIICLNYFFKYLPNQHDKAPYKTPVFYIATGCMIYFSGIIPLFLSLLIYNDVAVPVQNKLYVINAILLIAMHLFFIKAYTCKEKLITQ